MSLPGHLDYVVGGLIASLGLNGRGPNRAKAIDRSVYHTLPWPISTPVSVRLDGIEGSWPI